MNVSRTPAHDIGTVHHYGRYGGAFCSAFVVVTVDERSATLAEITETSERDAEGFFVTVRRVKATGERL